MFKNITTGGMKLIMSAAVIACVAVMVLSAAAASSMYLPKEDEFTSTLGKNLSTLCKNSGHSLSATQLAIIENAEIKAIEYKTDSDGNRLFSAKIRLMAPEENAGRYSDTEPLEYLKTNAAGMFTGSAEEIEILGLCSGGEGDLLPAVDVETLGKIADAAERAWKNEQLTSSRNFEYALTDLIIPEPFEDRKIGEGKEYTSAYTGWLDRCSSRFASEGLTVSKDGKQSSDSADIREAMEQVITPYLCSVRNVSLKSSEDKNGFITLSFDSLDVVGTLSSAKKPSVAALNKLCGVYSDERALKVTVNIDIVDLLDSGDSMSLPFFNIIRAITRYGSSIGASVAKVKIPESSQVIAGKSNGQWPIEFKRNKGDGNIILDVIQIADSGEEVPVLKVFLTDGGKITVCLKQGRYRLNLAVGSTYYGGKELFGANGIYMKDTKNIYTLPSTDLKSVIVEKQPGESLKFTDYLLGQGIDPSLIDKSAF